MKRLPVTQLSELELQRKISEANGSDDRIGALDLFRECDPFNAAADLFEHSQNLIKSDEPLPHDLKNWLSERLFCLVGEFRSDEKSAIKKRELLGLKPSKKGRRRKHLTEEDDLLVETVVGLYVDLGFAKTGKDQANTDYPIVELVRTTVKHHNKTVVSKNDVIKILNDSLPHGQFSDDVVSTIKDAYRHFKKLGFSDRNEVKKSGKPCAAALARLEFEKIHKHTTLQLFDVERLGKEYDRIKYQQTDEFLLEEVGLSPEEVYGGRS